MDYVKVHGSITGFIAPIGIVMNLCTIVIFSYMSSKTATTLLLRVLALFDIVFLGFSFATWTLASSYLSRGDVMEYIIQFGQISNLLQIALETSRICAAWITFAIIFLRYMNIHHPFTSQSIHRSLTAGFASFILLLLVTSSRVPLFLYSRESFTSGNHTNATVYNTEIENMVLGVFWNNIYFATDGLINLVIPVILTFALTHRVKVALHDAYEQRRQTSGYTGQEPEKGSGATMTLITLVFMHIICNIPALIFYALRLVSNADANNDTNSIPMKNCLIPTKVVSNMFFEWNAFIKFLIYYIVSQEFKDTFAAVLFRHSSRKKKEESHVAVELPYVSQQV